jgi:hypothetical protein
MTGVGEEAGPRRGLDDRSRRDRMETPDIALSAQRGIHVGLSPMAVKSAFTIDWLAVQRLKRIGVVGASDNGPKITAEGKRTVVAEAIKHPNESSGTCLSERIAVENRA